MYPESGRPRDAGGETPSGMPDATLAPLSRVYARRLREIYRSAGWPSQDAVEIELRAAGLVESVEGRSGHATLRLTPSGIAELARALAGNRAAFSAHSALEARVAAEMQRAGRIVWRGLCLRARVDDSGAAEPASRWCLAKPDVYSIRNTSVEDYLHPVAHEIKVRRADLLGDLRKPHKRAAYLDMAAECWYVLGQDGRGRSIADPTEIPLECGVLVQRGERLEVARPAPRRAMRLPFHVWLALAKATPLPTETDDAQASLMPCEEEETESGTPAAGVPGPAGPLPHGT